MTNPKAVGKYSAGFFEALESALDLGRIEMDIGAEGKAKRMRFKFYGFISALERSKESGHAKLAERYANLMFQVKETKLIIMKRDFEEFEMIIQANLAKQGLGSMVRANAMMEKLQLAESEKGTTNTESVVENMFGFTHDE